MMLSLFPDTRLVRLLKYRLRYTNPRPHAPTASPLTGIASNFTKTTKCFARAVSTSTYRRAHRFRENVEISAFGLRARRHLKRGTGEAGVARAQCRRRSPQRLRHARQIIDNNSIPLRRAFHAAYGPMLPDTGLQRGQPESPLAQIKEPHDRKASRLHRQAAEAGAQIVCLQEIFTGPYFCAEQNIRWYDSTEAIPAGPTIEIMRDAARRHRVALIVPIYEREQEGVYYNTAAVIHNDGSYLGKYRKTHIPHVAPGFWEKFYFRPGNLGFPVFDLGFAKIGVYICYDRHFPEGARALGLNGAEIVFNPSATVAGLSEYLWKLEQPAHAVANGYFVGAINRVGTEAPWNIGEFYGSSYFCDPRGRIFAQASRDPDEVLTADLDLE